jgi:predicted RecB family nuclease
MEAGVTITAASFLAFMRCPTKAHFLALGERQPETYFSNVEAGISLVYKSRAWQVLHGRGESAEPATFGQIRDGRSLATATLWIDCDTAVLDLAHSQLSSTKHHPRKTAAGHTIVPAVFSPWEKPDYSDSLLLCFGALALSQAIGMHTESGTLVFGDSFHRRSIRISDHAARLNQTIRLIGSMLQGATEPRLILNAHCAVCDFQSRCRRSAVDSDDLSLLSGMTSKDRTKAIARGISTISQLSYNYRPRRRRRSKPAAEPAARTVDGAHVRPPARHDIKLKALAIKKGRIHVVGSPFLKLQGVPIFIDVEDMPERSFYYLVGLRFESGTRAGERTFWADTPEEERRMWEKCLQTLKSIGNAQLVHYGAHETRFLRTMKKRYALEPDDSAFMDQLIENSINLVACIYGIIYFPTYSNSLKDVGRYLGYQWAWPQASGFSAILLRRTWELSGRDDLKNLLIAYNLDDCRAAEVVADALLRICAGGPSAPDSVDVASLEVGFQRTFGKFDSSLPEFAKINNAAYWDYQRSKVFVRTNTVVRRTIQESERYRQISGVDKEVTIEDSLSVCPKCAATNFYRSSPKRSNIIYDLKFSPKGIKRWTVKYRYSYHECSRCRTTQTIYQRKSKYGPSLRVFLIYLVIELRLSNKQAAEHVSLLFDLRLTKSAVVQIKSQMAEKYEPTYKGILKQIANGTLIHADETRGVVIGGGHYVWVFANMTTVAYVYAESRESAILETLLDGFKGVLVSDFYAAYDSVPCPQQKCLIHLMRDMNEDLNKNPFDEEFKDIAGRFGALLREIVETVDRYGLKARHLGKHRKAAERFVEHVTGLNCGTEVGRALQKRIEKNSDKLFTFLAYDGVPWNNNNAEHAVRAFTRLRNAISTSSPKGTRDYATLLSIQQTLRYRGRGFLEFMRSGEMEIAG